MRLIKLLLNRPVSIHASSREDATSYCADCAVHRGFQSTRPRGRTRRRQDFCRYPLLVSIHASSREDAT